MTEIKKYENMIVTVTCAEEVDSEMKELLEQYKVVQAVLSTTEKYFIPRIKAAGEAKLEVILKQLQGLANFAMEAGILTKNNWIRTIYVNDFSGKSEVILIFLKNEGGPCIQWTLNGNTTDTFRLDASVSGCAENSKFKSLFLDKDSWVVKWDEYNIYNKLRKEVVSKMKSKIEAMVKEKNKIIDTYHQITAK